MKTLVRRYQFKMSEFDELSKRIDRLEETVLHIPAQITEATDRAVVRAVDMAISKIGARRSSDIQRVPRNGPNLGMMVTFITIIVALSGSLIGLGFNGQGRVIDEAIKKVSRLEERFNGHDAKMGHPESIVTMLDSLEKRVINMDRWQEDHDQRVVRLNSSQNVRLDHLEDKMKFIDQTGWFNNLAKGNLDSVQNEKLRWLEKGVNDVAKEGREPESAKANA